jgi:hypothetical protein
MRMVKQCPDCLQYLKGNTKHRFGCPKKKHNRRPGQAVAEQNGLIPDKPANQATGLLFERPTRRAI